MQPDPSVLFSAQALSSPRGTLHRVFSGDKPLSYAAALTLMQESEAFRDLLSSSIGSTTSKAIRWESPPISKSTVARPFEFVLVDAPFLDTAPEPEVFAPYFAGPEGRDLDVLAVPNLGRTAKLVVPRQILRPEVYVHLKAFLLQAPAHQVHSLWQTVAATALGELSSRPLWVSTAGGGVNWLHVRLERSPKYYAYRPYADAA